jgi:putative SOS response-associated peptidase YedK
VPRAGDIVLRAAWQPVAGDVALVRSRGRRRQLFAFAGLWQRHKGPVKKDGPVVELDEFSFMTGEPNALTATINHERSPVLLTTPEEWATWTTGTPEEAFALVRPIMPERLRIVQDGLEKRDLLAA